MDLRAQETPPGEDPLLSHGSAGHLSVDGSPAALHRGQGPPTWNYLKSIPGVFILQGSISHACK